MKKRMRFTPYQFSVASLLVVLALVRVMLVLAPLDFLLTHMVPDDAFYYFVIAKNIVIGNGPTFDRLAPTNGYHPLWLIVLVATYSITGIDTMNSIRIPLALNALFDIGAIVVLVTTLHRLRITRSVTIATLVVYGLSPLSLITAMGPLNGLETSLASLLTLCAYLAYVAVQTSGPSRRKMVVLGCLMGLLFLSRTDSAILIACLWLAVVAFARRQSGQRLAVLLGMACTAVVAAPWLLYSYGQFGAFVQVSGQSSAFVNREIAKLQGWSTIDDVGQVIQNLARALAYTFSVMIPRQSWEILLLLTSALTLAFALYRSKRSDMGTYLVRSACKDRRTVAWFPVAIAFGLFVVVQTLRAINMRPWYYFSFLALLLIGFALALDCAITRHNLDRKSVVAGVLLLVLSIQVVALSRIVGSESLGETGKYAMARRMNQLLPKGAIVGAWNAGVIGWYFANGTVVNLDGVVNNVAYLHIQDHSLAEYAERTGVSYIVDESDTVSGPWVRNFWRKSTKGKTDEFREVESQAGITLWRWHP